MKQQHRYRLPVLVALAALLFTAAHLGYEYLNGGVRGHHVLNRADMPLISNWLGVLVLPLLGWALGIRLRNQLNAVGERTSTRVICLGFAAALLYGAALAISFERDASTVTSSLFFALFVVAVVLPIYRAEYILGFVMGMTVTFGGVLPALISVIFVTTSFVVRYLLRMLVSAVRRRRVVGARVESVS